MASLDLTINEDGLPTEETEANTMDAASLYGDEDSLEAIAGIEMPVSTPVTEAIEEPSGGPPLPKSGLPDGWTTDQWKWYGQEWLDKNQ